MRFRFDPGLIRRFGAVLRSSNPPWAPTNPSIGIAGWIAGQGQTLASGDLSAITDIYPTISGSSDLSQGTAENRPQYVAGSPSYLYFSGSESVNGGAADPSLRQFINGTGGTLLAVLRPIGASETVGTIISFGGASAAQQGFRFRYQPSTGRLFSNISNGTTQVFNMTEASVTMTTNALHRVAIRFQYDISGDDLEIWVDGAKIRGEESAAAPADLDPAAMTVIGASLEMQFYEARILGARLSDSELSDWFSWALREYGA